MVFFVHLAELGVVSVADELRDLDEAVLAGGGEFAGLFHARGEKVLAEAAATSRRKSEER